MTLGLTETIWLDEEMISLDQATSQGIAFHINKNQHFIRLVLFKPEAAEHYFRTNPKERVMLRKEVFVGWLVMLKNSGCGLAKGYEIKLSNANKGYGPLLYELAMSATNGGWLMSDRKSVSDKAVHVWNRMFERSDVEHTFIGNKCYPPRKEESLKYAYRLRAPLDYQSYGDTGASLIADVADAVNSDPAWVEMELLRQAETWALNSF